MASFGLSASELYVPRDEKAEKEKSGDDRMSGKKKRKRDVEFVGRTAD